MHGEEGERKEEQVCAKEEISPKLFVQKSYKVLKNSLKEFSSS